MVKKLRLKIMAVTMLSLLVVFSFIAFFVLYGTHYNFKNNTLNTLTEIAENKGALPKDVLHQSFAIPYFSILGHIVSSDPPYETRYFTVRTDNEGNIISMDTSRLEEISLEKASILVKAVFPNKDSGMHRQYRYMAYEPEKGVTEYIFLNCTSSLRWLYFVYSSLLVTLTVVLGITALLVWLFSKRIVQTFYYNLENQKKFITNASHEIKTPISIIDANAEVLKYTTGENEWIDSIQNQTKRLTKLVKRLITLSKAEENSVSEPFVKFSVSDAVYETTRAFSPAIEGRGLTLYESIENGLILKGNEELIRQLIEVILENAVKYCSENGTISVGLHPKGRGVIFKVKNDCNDIDKEKLSNLFDRFFRADDSRSRKTGGFGIGLSIAKAIVTTHKGKITAESEDGSSITFTVVL